MKYRVVFRERATQGGAVADSPPDFLDNELDGETVTDSVFVGRNDPDAQHSTGDLEEDDDFLSLGTEIWEYDVADGRSDDFKAALARSGMVIEYEALDSAGELNAT